MPNPIFNNLVSTALKITCILVMLLPHRAYSEYRVYQYYVTSKHINNIDSNAYQVVSTLDPQAYKAYHGGSQAIKVDLIKTWTCPGYTGGRRPICSAPQDEITTNDTHQLNLDLD